MTTIGRRPPYTALAQPRPRRTAPRVRQLQGLGGVSRATTALATATSGPSRPGAGRRSRSPGRRPDRTSGSGTAGSRNRTAPRASRGPARSQPATPSSPTERSVRSARPEQRVLRPGQVVHARRPAVRELRPCEPVELGHEQVLGDRAAVRLRVNDDRLPAPGVASRQRSGVSRREPARLVRRHAETERRGSLLGRIDVYERGVQRAGSAGAPWRRCHSRGSWRRLRPSTREARCGLRPAACNSRKRV